jgi:protein arginine N-methyltransferase 1
MLCCRAGARRVYAIEAGPVGRLAEQVIASNHLSERITLIKGISTDVRLPEPVDVIVSEIIGNAAFDEGILQYLADARERFLAPGGRIIPRTVALMVAPVGNAGIHQKLVGAWREPVAGFDVSALVPAAAQQLHAVSLQPQHLLAAPQRIATAVLSDVERPFLSGKAELEVAADGAIEGLGLWFESELADGLPLSNGVPSATTSWSCGFLGLIEPQSVRAGDRVQLEMACHDGQTWRWRGAVGGETFDLNTLAGRSIDREDLLGDGRRPTLGARGRLTAAALELFDGRRTVAEIARELQGAGGEQGLPTEAAARSFVAGLAGRYRS